MPGAVLTGDSAGLRQRAQAEGHPLRHALGHAGRRGDLRAAARRAPTRPRRARWTGYDRRVARATSGATCTRCGTCARRWARASAVGGPAGGMMDITRGRAARRHAGSSIATPTRAVEPDPGSACTRRRTASSPSTSSPACSCRATAAATTSPTTSACSSTCRARWPRPGWRCARPRSTRSAATTAAPPCELKLAPSNCVQCGAITAKGGRLTPPEGGSGPEYTPM